MISKHQIKLIHTLLSQYAKHRGFPIDTEEKKKFVADCSGGRCTSTTQLHNSEARILIDSLQKLTANTTEFQKADRQRKLMIHFAHQMGWNLPPAPSLPGEGGKLKIDMKRIDAWCIKTGYLHKPLMKYTGAELGRLVQQFQKMYLEFLKRI